MPFGESPLVARWHCGALVRAKTRCGQPVRGVALLGTSAPVKPPGRSFHVALGLTLTGSLRPLVDEHLSSSFWMSSSAKGEA
jgi:hypothetical protein